MTTKRIRPTREQIKLGRYRQLITDLLEALFEHNDDNYYDYTLRLRDIEEKGLKRRMAANHYGADDGPSDIKVYKFIGGE